MDEPPSKPGYNVAKVTSDVCALFEPLSPADRSKVLQAVMILLGEQVPEPMVQRQGGQQDQPHSGVQPRGGHASGDLKRYFAEKAPKNKKETLAIAARWAQLHEGKETVAKDDFKRLIIGAGRHFDAHNFSMDITDAKRSSGFFVAGTGKDEYRLTYFGEQFVDALPNREVADQLARPKSKKVRATSARKPRAS